MSHDTMPENGFDQMSLSTAVQSAVLNAGYKSPTPVQSATIPLMLENSDIIGQARTGTGKTAAFALPLLSRIDLSLRRPQVLILTPTRELAIQVAESFETYGKAMKGLNVLAVYGGQSYGIQLNQLKKGVHVIVGTPGRLMDHIRRKTISLAHLFSKVLDEADEMLHMGFIEDVEWIFDQTPNQTQTALFSATMPAPIRKIANKYLKDPETITIQSDASDLASITQQYWLVKGCQKSHGLVRFLDAVTFDGVIIFVKTKASTLSVCKVLEDRGFKTEALNGDMAQAAREKTVNRLKRGHIDILVATDVAARGLDVERISHVINYDMPSKTEPYIHRIGRTGRAGRTGDAILFIHPKERWMVRKLENATSQKINEVHLPSNKAINKKRVADFKSAISQVLESQDLTVFQDLVTDYAQEHYVPMESIAAALGRLVHGDTPFLLDKKEKIKPATRPVQALSKRPKEKKNSSRQNPMASKTTKQETQTPFLPPKKGMDRYRIEVGRSHGVSARDIVGAISNEAGLESKFITGVTIRNKFTVVDLPAGMPGDIFHLLKKTWVKSRPMGISKVA
ncbi:MAG: DEAD/DEAH box helicase [Desulfobacter sp.]|nr:MAG: DEAD/DEAH box helicase [Desulfobacter sp.]